MTSKVPKKLLGPCHLLGQCWKGKHVFLLGHTLCKWTSITAETKAGTPGGAGLEQKHVAQSPCTQGHKQPLQTCTKLRTESRESFSVLPKVFFKKYNILNLKTFEL